MGALTAPRENTCWVPPDQMFLTYCPIPRKLQFVSADRWHVSVLINPDIDYSPLNEHSAVVRRRFEVEHVELRTVAHGLNWGRSYCDYAWEPRTRTIFMHDPTFKRAVRYFGLETWERCTPGDFELAIRDAEPRAE